LTQKRWYAQTDQILEVVSPKGGAAHMFVNRRAHMAVGMLGCKVCGWFEHKNSAKTYANCWCSGRTVGCDVHQSPVLPAVGSIPTTGPAGALQNSGNNFKHLKRKPTHIAIAVGLFIAWVGVCPRSPGAVTNEVTGLVDQTAVNKKPAAKKAAVKKIVVGQLSKNRTVSSIYLVEVD
jgi:hypothetical protein